MHALPESNLAQDSDKVDNGDIPTPPYESKSKSKSLTFAAIPNPTTNDNYPSQNQVPTSLFMINDGIDHWDSISKGGNFMYTQL